jgi:selenocysteine lyase/cysteine desulfurase
MLRLESARDIPALDALYNSAADVDRLVAALRQRGRR